MRAAEETGGPAIGGGRPGRAAAASGLMGAETRPPVICHARAGPAPVNEPAARAGGLRLTVTGLRRENAFFRGGSGARRGVGTWNTWRRAAAVS